jgi:hypothetical protein
MSLILEVVLLSLHTQMLQSTFLKSSITEHQQQSLSNGTMA